MRMIRSNEKDWARRHCIAPFARYLALSGKHTRVTRPGKPPIVGAAADVSANGQ